jgi:hypothetical protein
MQKIAKLISLSVVLFTTEAWSIPFTNGDFNSGQANWNALQNANSPGSVNIDQAQGLARLTTGASWDLAAQPSVSLIQGDDGSFNFATPLSLGAQDSPLVFDVSFARTAEDALETGTSSFADYLAIILYDALDITGSHDLILTPSPAIDNLLSGFQTYSFDVSALAGRDVALSFELFDENDGWNSTATLRNIRFDSATSPTVPEPTTWALLGLGLVGWMGVFRMRRLD